MSDTKSEVLYAAGVLNDSVRDVEQAVLSLEHTIAENHREQTKKLDDLKRQLEVVRLQGESASKYLGQIDTAIGRLHDTLNTYIDEQGKDSSLGARLTRLEGRVDRIGSDG